MADVSYTVNDMKTGGKYQIRLHDNGDGTYSLSSAVGTMKGAANVSVGQVTAGAAATLVVARPTRRGVLIKNLDTSLTAYIGPATVTAANGLELKAGESVVVSWTGLIQRFAASGSPVVAFWDEYD